MEILVKPSLRGVSRGLLAVTLMTAVFALCPCPAGAEAMMDDCCPSAELSISGMCCDRAAGPTTGVSPASVLVLMSTPAVAHSPAIQPAVMVSVHAQASLARPIVARSILRI